eukprot:gene1755-4869_t
MRRAQLFGKKEELAGGKTPINCSRGRNGLEESGKGRTMSSKSDNIQNLQRELDQSQFEATEAKETVNRMKASNTASADRRLAHIEELESASRLYIDEMKSLKEALENISDEYTAVDKEHVKLLNKHQDVMHENEMLTKDKHYLEQQLCREQNTTNILHAQLNDLQMKLRASESKQRTLQIDVEAQMAQQRQQLEEKLSQQLETLRQRNEHEMEILRKSNEMREVEAMRQDRDRAIHARNITEAKLQSTERRYSEDREKLQHRVNELEKQLAQTMADSKLKSFEHDRAEILLNESRNQTQSLQLKVEKLTEESRIIRDEYASLELNSKANEDSLRKQLEASHHQVEIFNRLQEELDRVVMAAAEASDPTPVLLAHGVGAGAQQQIHKTLGLARQLLEARREAESSKKKENELRQELEDTQTKLREAHHVINSSSQPLSFFMNLLSEKENALESTKAELHLVQETLLRVREELQSVTKERDRFHKLADQGRRHEAHLRNLQRKFQSMIIPKMSVHHSMFPPYVYDTDWKFYLHHYNLPDFDVILTFTSGFTKVEINWERDRQRPDPIHVYNTPETLK